jgi:beta-phosphoglucomutase family hydrolase
MANKWGAIFDFDGVIVDTEWHHEVCWLSLAKELALPITHEQYVSGFGVKNERFIKEILAWSDDPEEIQMLAKRKEAIFQEHAKTATIHLLQGLQPFLLALQKRGIACAIASSSILKNIEIILENSSIPSFFSAVVSGEDVSVGKPDPACFLTAAKKIALPSHQCVVFEDALLGVEGAKRAGCKVVALTTTFEKGQFEALPYRLEAIIENFDEISVDEIAEWFS